MRAQQAQLPWPCWQPPLSRLLLLLLGCIGAGIALRSWWPRRWTQQHRPVQGRWDGGHQLGVVHDLTNALLAAQTGVEELFLTMRHHERLALAPARASVDQSFRILRQLVDDLRTGAVQNHQPPLRLTPTHLDQVVTAVTDHLQPLAAHHRCVVKVDCSPALPVMWLDRWRIERVLTNLVENAITYTGHARSDGRVGIQMGVEVPWVWVAVVDNGPGINPARLRSSDCLQAIHHAAHTTGDMRLGLSISRRLVEQLGGYLAITSAGPAGGTTVRIWLPLHPIHRAAPQ